MGRYLRQHPGFFENLQKVHEKVFWLIRVVFPKKYLKYLKEYRLSNIASMIRNGKAESRICNEDFHNRLVVITGATSGIGKCTAAKYASHGANLLCINRNETKSRALSEEIQSDYGVTCEYKIADFSRLEDVHRVGRKLMEMDTPIDVLIHNAGLYNTTRKITGDGIEMIFAVDYLSSFILNYMLMDKLRSQNDVRILYVNSEAHRFAVLGLRLDDLNWTKRIYTGLRSYGSAKMAQLLSMIVFNDLLATSHVTINALHPGAVKSNSGRNNGPIYKWLKQHFLEKNLKSTEISADALYYLGVSKEVDGVSGKFFSLTTVEEPAPPALDRQTANELWEISLELGELRGKE